AELLVQPALDLARFEVAHRLSPREAPGAFHALDDAPLRFPPPFTAPECRGVNLLQPFQQRDLAVARIRPLQALLAILQLALGEREVMRAQRFTIELVPGADPGMIDAGGPVEVKPDGALNFDPFRLLLRWRSRMTCDSV